MKAGLYIHIPFCESRCIYCGFYSTTAKDWRTRYVDALLKEMHMRSGELKALYPDHECTIDTVYIGGGTPSTLSIDDLSRIINTIKAVFPCKTREITIEMNPDDVTTELISAVSNLGVNRISLGVQTFSDERLRFIRRRHNAAQAAKAVETIRRAGIDNISIDLMFGFPNETLNDWQNDLDAALKLRPNHISAYSLMYEEGTPLYLMLQNDKVQQTDDDTCLAMYTMLMDTLSANGYEHYEISNFAKPEHRSLHNSSYWHDVPYLGFGASAHSYTIGKRSSNVADIRQYMESLRTGILPSSMEIIDDDTHYDDLVTTAIRTKEGLYVDSLKPKYREYIMKAAKRNIDAGLMAMDNGHLHLTRKGLFVSDMVMCDLIYT